MLGITYVRSVTNLLAVVLVFYSHLTRLDVSWTWMCTSAAAEEASALEYASLSFSLCRRLVVRVRF